VQEETNLDVFDRLIRGTLVVDLLTQQPGEKHQMVILHPDQIAVAYNFCDGLGKQAVGLLVCAPILLIERDLTGVVMEQGPENAIDKGENERNAHTRIIFIIIRRIQKKENVNISLGSMIPLCLDVRLPLSLS
jgi:hypothetical protein